MILLIPKDIIQIISNYCDFLSQIRLSQVNSYFHKNIQIENFRNIPKKYLKLLNDNILLNYKNIKYLYASDNPNITDVNHLSNLRILEARGDSCGISDNSI